jgi:hypothetical protein
MNLKQNNFVNCIKKFIRLFFSYRLEMQWKVGDYVVDDLTLRVCKIAGIEWAEGKSVAHDGRIVNHMGSIGIWLDNDYLDGGRHPWEISEPLKPEDIKKWEHELDIYRKKLEQKQSSKL